MGDSITDSKTDEPTASLPTAEDAAMAAYGSRVLASYLKKKGQSVRLRLVDGEQELDLPASALPLLRELLKQLGQGNSVALTPLRTELSTQQAAAILQVSRPYVVKLLEQGELPFHRVGNRRRLHLSDVFTTPKTPQEYLQTLSAQGLKKRRRISRTVRCRTLM